MLGQLYLIPSIPFAGFLILALCGGRMRERSQAVVGVGSVALSMLLAFSVSVAFVTQSSSVAPSLFAYSQNLWNWLSVDGFAPSFGLRLDGLSLVMVLVVTLVGFLIHLYSVGFMSGDDGFARFFAYLNLFVGSMLLLVLADNLLLLYLGWEAVGLCSYLLIGFWYRDPANGRAAMKAFLVTRVGDTAFAIGLLVLFVGLGTPDIREIGERALHTWPVGSLLPVTAAALLLGGACGKSAQLPLQTWLPDAMAGPTPVSALIHAATMVTAGVYLIARMNIIFSLAPVVSAAVAVIGVLTLLLAGWSALFQNDIKRVLAYSTMSQVGYMFLALGVGAWSAAIFHFLTHAFFKALLFLAAGVVIQAAANEHDIFMMGGLRRRLPGAFRAFLIGAASLSALPFVTAGFYSKEMILGTVFTSASGGVLLWLGGTIGAFLTAVYAFRVVFVVFFGDEKRRVEPSTNGFTMTPLVVLGVLSIGAGFLGYRSIFGRISIPGLLQPTLPGASAHAAVAGSDVSLMIVTSLVSLGGVGAAFLLYSRRAIDRRRGVPDPASRFFQAGWGFDRLYEALFVSPYAGLARLDRNDVVDAFYRGLTAIATRSSRALASTQSGFVRWYALAIAAGAVAFLAIMVFA